MPDMTGITTDVFWIIKGNNEKFSPSHGVVIPFQ